MQFYIPFNHPDKNVILERSPKLREYRHLTGYFFFGGQGGGYVDPAIFRDHYIDQPSFWDERDANSGRQMLHIVNLEQFPIDDFENPNWQDWTDQYIRILRMMRASGREALLYGIDGGGSVEFRGNWHIGRLVFDRSKMGHVRKWIKLEKETERRVEVCADRFRDHLDAVVVNGYCPYEIPAVDSSEMRAYLYNLQQKCELRKKHYPGLDVVLFMQSKFTGGGQPWPLDVWEYAIEFAALSPFIDRVCIFSKQTDNQDEPAGWADCLVNLSHLQSE